MPKKKTVEEEIIEEYVEPEVEENWVSPTNFPSNLADTAGFMNSEDYKDRFIAEYYQAKIRIDKLRNMLTSWDAKTLDFEPTCPRNVLSKQYEMMNQYLYILEVRAKIENIPLQ